MDIQSLVLLTAAKIASLIKGNTLTDYDHGWGINFFLIFSLGKTDAEIRAIFNIRDDYTPADEAEVYRQFAFLITDDEKTAESLVTTEEKTAAALP